MKKSHMKNYEEISKENGLLEKRVYELTQKLDEKNIQLQQEIEKLETLKKQVVVTARQASMIEVATSVLHSVANILNSVNISTDIIAKKIMHTRLNSLHKISELLQKHASDLSIFISEDPKGKLLPELLIALSNAWKKEKDIISQELKNLIKSINHIKNIVTIQQSLSSSSNLIEKISIHELLENIINIAGLRRHNIQINRNYNAIEIIEADKTKLIQVLINLMTNAKDSLKNTTRADKVIIIDTKNIDSKRLQIQIIDNGVGISDEAKKNIFTYGFTTKKTGHGFGLHSSALIAKNMGGSLSFFSAGINEGATFTLELSTK